MKRLSRHVVPPPLALAALVTALLLAAGPAATGHPHHLDLPAPGTVVNYDAGHPELYTLEGPGVEKGAWYVPPLPPESDRMQAVHMAMLPNGYVLIVNGSSNRNRIVDGHILEGVDTRDFAVVDNVAIWNPAAPLGTPGLRRIAAPPTPGADGEAVDLFCSAHHQLADGNVLFVSGTREYVPGDNFYGSKVTRLFNWQTEGWSDAGKLVDGHWYPALAELADGRIVVLSGIAYDNFSNSPWIEIYDPAAPVGQRWTAVDSRTIPNSPFSAPAGKGGGRDTLDHYPRLAPTPDGRLFISGDGSGGGDQVSRNTYYMEIGPPKSGGQPPEIRFTLGPPRPDPRKTYNTAFQDPVRQDGTEIYIGGMVNSDNFNYGPPFPPPNPSIRTTAMLERFTPGAGGGGQWKVTEDFLGRGPEAARLMHVGVLLPTRQVLVMGGGNYGYYGPMVRPQLLTPDAKAPGGFRVATMNPGTQPRLYHNNAILLPDGRVLAAGGNVFRAARDVATGKVRLDTWQRPDGAYQFTPQGLAWTPPAEVWQMEVFYPPYLFLPGPRPVVTAPAAAVYGEEVKVEVGNATEGGSVVLIKLPSVTHGWDMAQHLTDLPVVRRAGSTFTVRMPTNANLHPPGYSMLFYVNAQGKPSEAAMVRLDRK